MATKAKEIKVKAGYEIVVPGVDGNGLALVKWSFESDKTGEMVTLMGTGYPKKLDEVDKHNYLVAKKDDSVKGQPKWTYRFAIKDQYSKQAAARLLTMIENKKFLAALKAFTK